MSLAKCQCSDEPERCLGPLVALRFARNGRKERPMTAEEKGRNRRDRRHSLR